MKLKLNHLIFFGIIIQIISTQGVLTYLFFNLFGYWELKSLVHPISLFFILIFFILKTIHKIKITGIDLLVILYFLFLFTLLCYNSNGISSIYLGFRDIFLIFVLTFFYNQFTLTHSQYKTVLKLLHYLVLVNLFMIFLTYFLGPEGFMKFITGRYQWGTDEVTKFQISSFVSKFLRSPAAVGSSGAVSYFALLTFFLMDKWDGYKTEKFYAFLLLFLTFTRSALLALIIYLILSFLIKKKNFKKLKLIVKYGLPIIIVGLIFINQLEIFSAKSLFIRFEIWFNEINVDFNLFYGGAIGNIGSAVRGSGAEAILDNYWLLLLFSSGVIGIFIWLVFFYEKAMKSNKIVIAVIGILASGFFITLTQAIPFLVMFPMLFLNTDKNNEIHVK